jgi:cobalt-zinc-cadmium efflux system protein
VGGFPGVAVLKSDDFKAPMNQRGTEVVMPIQQVGADAHGQQQRIVGGAEPLVGDLDPSVAGGGGVRAHAASIIGKMSKAGGLGLVLGLNLLLVGALVIVGVAAHSLGVLAAGVDYLADAAAIAVSLLALRLARQPLRQHPRRWTDPTHVAALVNAGWLLVLNMGVVVAAIRRLVAGTVEVHGLPVLIVSAAAALVMFVGAIIVGGNLDDDDGGEDLNIKAVLLDTAADAAAASGVAFTGAVILTTHAWYGLDPAVALVIARRDRLSRGRPDLARSNGDQNESNVTSRRTAVAGRRVGHLMGPLTHRSRCSAFANSHG